MTQEKERKAGYYWVRMAKTKFNGSDPEPAYWNGIAWNILGFDHRCSDNVFIEIDESPITREKPKDEQKALEKWVTAIKKEIKRTELLRDDHENVNLGDEDWCAYSNHITALNWVLSLTPSKESEPDLTIQLESAIRQDDNGNFYLELNGERWTKLKVSEPKTDNRTDQMPESFYQQLSSVLVNLSNNKITFHEAMNKIDVLYKP